MNEKFQKKIFKQISKFKILNQHNKINNNTIKKYIFKKVNFPFKIRNKMAEKS